MKTVPNSTGTKHKLTNWFYLMIWLYLIKIFFFKSLFIYFLIWTHFINNLMGLEKILITSYSPFFSIFIRLTCLHVLKVGRKKNWNVSMTAFWIITLAQIYIKYFIISKLIAYNCCFVWYLCVKNYVYNKNIGIHCYTINYSMRWNSFYTRTF